MVKVAGGVKGHNSSSRTSYNAVTLLALFLDQTLPSLLSSLICISSIRFNFCMECSLPLGDLKVFYQLSSINPLNTPCRTGRTVGADHGESAAEPWIATRSLDFQFPTLASRPHSIFVKGTSED